MITPPRSESTCCQQAAVPQNMFDQTKVFSLCRIVYGSESSPAPVHTSLGVSPFKRAELQQHKAAISPKKRSHCQLLLRPTKAVPATETKPTPSSLLNLQSDDQKVTEVARQLGQKQAGHQLQTKHPFM